MGNIYLLSMLQTQYNPKYVHPLCIGTHFNKMIQLQVVTSIIKWEKELRNQSQTPTIAPLKFGDGLVISYHML